MRDKEPVKEAFLATIIILWTSFVFLSYLFIFAAPKIKEVLSR